MNRQWFVDNAVELMDWPSQSPDLNPIENLWSIIDDKLRFHQCNNEDELFAVLEEAWKVLQPDLLSKLVRSMTARCNAVIKNKGFATMY